jgi:DNA repair protein RadC
VLPLIEETAQPVEQLQDIKAERKEHFVGLYLNARHELIHKEIVSIGTVNASIVHPRDVFAPAILHHAVEVIVAHNHPSGVPQLAQSLRCRRCSMQGPRYTTYEKLLKAKTLSDLIA